MRWFNRRLKVRRWRALRRALEVIALVTVLVLGSSVGTPAQEPLRVETLYISLWPEYDDPRLLVILSGRLNRSGVDLRVPLPEGAQLHAAAYVDAEGNLLTASWQMETVNGQNVVVVSVPTQEFQVEYYVDAIVPGRETVIQARIPVPEAEIAQAFLTVQEPANTENLRGVPALGTPEPGLNGLRYASRVLGPLAPGTVVEQEVRYTRLAPGLSAPPRTAPEPTPPPTPSPPAGRPWIPLLIGVGALLVVATGIGYYWFWRRSKVVSTTTDISPGEFSSAETPQLARYCPNCGHPYGPEDRFCAMCGTRRPTYP